MQTPDFEKMPILKGILASLKQGVAIFSADKKLLYINPAMTEVTGRSDKSVGSALEQLSRRHRLRTADGVPLEPEDFPVARAFEGFDTHDEPYIYLDSTDNYVWLSVSCFRINDEAGDLQYVVCTIANISARKSREDKLKFMLESAKILSITEDFYQRLTQKAKLAVPLLADWCAIDLLRGKETERVVVVHQDKKMMDYIFDFQKKYPPDPTAPGSVLNVIKNQKAQFIPVITEEMLVAGTKSPEHLEDIRKLQLKSIMVVPITARGKGLGAMTIAYAESGRVYTTDDLQFFQEFCTHIGVLLDNARLYEAIRKRDEGKDLFLASLSHELRNPLAPIKSALELLKMREVTPETREELDIIEHQFDHMSHLLNDLLDVTRFTQAKIPVNPQRTELRHLVERALKATDALVRNADITLHFTYPSTPLDIDVDETRVEQAVINLMSNAIKFTPAGGSIWVDVEKAGECAIIRVRDNGAGISAEDLPNIFDMYYQGGHTRDSANTGLGIGLLLVKKIAELHKGSIEAKSEGEGAGSEFTIKLPIAEPASKTPVPAPGRSDASGKRILIVDDNMQAADSLVKLLNKVGAQAQALYSGEEALAHGAEEYDVILLDVGMPRMDGYELVRELRKRGIDCPIIALTGYGMAEDKKRALDAGFTSHLTKPIGLKELTAALHGLRT